MTSKLDSQPAMFGGLSLRARQSATLLPTPRPEYADSQHAVNAHLNPMVAQSTGWREVGMVCGQEMTVTISGIGHTDVIDVTDPKFSTRVGPGAASPPV